MSSFLGEEDANRRGDSSRHVEYNVHNRIKIQNHKDSCKKICQETGKDIYKKNISVRLNKH